jgi:cytochrome P450
MMAAAPRFDVARLERQPVGYRLLMALANYPFLQMLLDAARWWTPAVRVPGGLTFILRHDDVRQVLGDSKAFPVPWGWKMALVTSNRPDGLQGGDDGRNFVLGMKEADADYQLDYAMLARAFPYGEVETRVPRLATEATTSALDRFSNGDEFDAVEGLVAAVPTALCASYYGLDIPDPAHFAKCTLAVSSFLFGADFDPPADGRPDRGMAMALDAAPEIRRVIRASMSRPFDGDPANPLQRLLRDKERGEAGEALLNRVHAQLFGMAMGFIPTNVLAGGNILETLLRQPHFKAKVIEAVDVGDDDLLWRCLRETLRFRNINFGPLRVCAQDVNLQAEGGRVRIRRGDKVLASTQSAMFDRRRIEHPHVFDSGRPDQDHLSFGVGQHWCLGAYIAKAQLTQMFKALFTHFDVQPVKGAAGRMRRFQVFPLHLRVRLQPR